MTNTVENNRRANYQTVAFILIIICFAVVDAIEEIRCNSVDIRNHPNLPNSLQNNYRKCTVIEGDFSLAMIQSINVTENNFPVFENLVEITGHLIVYQVRGLRSLSTIFPRLRVIGGRSLVMNYAIVIFQNIDLREIGLYRLATIRNGGVRIVENPRLCYGRSIDWNAIMTGAVNDVLVDEQTRNHDRCANRCSPSNRSRCHKIGGESSTNACTGPYHCQILRSFFRLQLFASEYKGTDALALDAGPGCDDTTGRKCADECVGGCVRPDDPSACYSCRSIYHNGRCVPYCPSKMYRLLHRRCVTAIECHNLTLKPMSSSSPSTTAHLDVLSWKAFAGVCHYECPRGYQIDRNNTRHCRKCMGYCPKRCRGGSVNSIDSALYYKGCNIVEGKLEIEIRTGMDSTDAAKLVEAFGEIEEIDDYLLVRFSASFVSLHMFKQLRRINGRTLWRQRYALSVFENANLRQIFDMDRLNLSITHGNMYFQNNRMLCYRKIETLAQRLGLANQFSDIDVSQYSNGYRAICDEISFDAKVEYLYDDIVVLQWTAFDTSDMDHRKFLGYQVFYKIVDGPDQQINIDDERSACSDSWKTYTESEETNISENDDNQTETLSRGTMITGIQPNTWYAFYVQTKLVNHPGARNAISRIQFFKTLFGTPGPPRSKTAPESLHPDRIDLNWDPPSIPNGDITHYRVVWTLIPDDDDHAETADNYCSETAKQKQDQRAVDDRLRSTTSPHTPYYSPSSIHLYQQQQDTCSRTQQGCCDCSSNKIETTTVAQNIDDQSGTEEKLQHFTFEDAIQNIIYVPDESKLPQNSHRWKRTIDTDTAAFADVDIDNIGDYSFDNESQSEDDAASPPLLEEKTINVTATNLSITGLRHFSDYQVKVYACQNISHPQHYCSLRSTFDVVRTAPIADKDRIVNDSVVVMNGTDDRSRRIWWIGPHDPNGQLFAYRVKVKNVEKNWTPIELCLMAADFRRNKGAIISGLTDGIYQLEVRAFTTNGLGPATIFPALFVIRTPSFFTWPMIAVTMLVICAALSTIAFLMYYAFNCYFGKKIREYVISVNPDYDLSQLEVYKPDEWELQRADLQLEAEEIGHGTFGKVFRGRTVSGGLRSQCGVLFNECAVKTVAESANFGERLHFLIEASVMKRFNTSFIVKLYGVVSDGQPVLVVMELMAKGNLRDYLRSRRPDADENIDNLSAPCEAELYQWAAQIADGMAYLESIKFCHRDLAARNCMVSADNVIKIGDFGMARDIYYHEYYKPTGKRLMPVRWMAPESLKDGKFTMKSDVWSYGIVLYEMLTLAQQPYAGLANDEVFSYIGVSRMILKRPTDCPMFWYELMVRCWKYDPRERPSFAAIVDILLPHTASQFKSLSFVVNSREKSAPMTLPSYDDDAQTDHIAEIVEPVFSSDNKNHVQSPFIDSDNPKKFDADENNEELRTQVCSMNRRSPNVSLGVITTTAM